jgi:hypothetical protein
MLEPIFEHIGGPIITPVLFSVDHVDKNLKLAFVRVVLESLDSLGLADEPVLDA